MARKVQILLTDDLSNDETPADETVTFALDGTSYEIDLSEKNAAALRKAFGKYVEAARKVGRLAAVSGGRKTASRSASNDGPDKKAVREWANANGHTVSDRGRIPTAVIEAYLASNVA